MRYFVSFCLAAAVVLGAATAPVFGCGGSTGGATGCKVATSPVLPTVRFLVTLFDALMP